MTDVEDGGAKFSEKISDYDIQKMRLQEKLPTVIP
jgi:hypothetical protein